MDAIGLRLAGSPVVVNPPGSSRKSPVMPATMRFSVREGAVRSRRGVSGPPASSKGAAVTNGGASSSGSEFYTVGEFMTRKENLHVVKPTTPIDRALEMLVQYRVSGFPVIDDNWKLVGVVSDYDLLALDSISGSGQTEKGLFPNVDSSWKTFNEIQKLLNKNQGKFISDVMTEAPLVVHESSNLEDAARMLLQSKYRRLPVVDAAGQLVGMITRGNMVKAALRIKLEKEKGNQ